LCLQNVSGDVIYGLGADSPLVTVPIGAWRYVLFATPYSD
jgi:hypothetical protein